MSGFWQWFVTRRWGDPGIAKFRDRWLFIHFAIGILLAWAIPSPLAEAARTVLLPLASVFVGLSFAWAGNAHALLQTTEIERFTEKHPAGVRNYVFTFLAAILAILVTLVLWGLAGLGLFDKRWPTSNNPHVYFAVAALLYGCASLTLRECWQVVNGAQLLLITRRDIRDVTPAEKYRRDNPRVPDG
jgi:hypothetical protein